MLLGAVLARFGAPSWAPRRPKIGPKTESFWSGWAIFWSARAIFGSLSSRRLPDPPGTPPRGPRDPPNGPQDPPGPLQEATGTPQMASRTPPDSILELLWGAYVGRFGPQVRVLSRPRPAKAAKTAKSDRADRTSARHDFQNDKPSPTRPSKT